MYGVDGSNKLIKMQVGKPGSMNGQIIVSRDAGNYGTLLYIDDMLLFRH